MGQPASVLLHLCLASDKGSRHPRRVVRDTGIAPRAPCGGLSAALTLHGREEPLNLLAELALVGGLIPARVTPGPVPLVEHGTRDGAVRDRLDVFLEKRPSRIRIGPGIHSARLGRRPER